MKNKWLYLILLFVLIFGVSVVANFINDNKSSIIVGSIDIDNSDEIINWDKYPKTDITLTETVNITRSGTYHLTGTLENGMVFIKVSKEEKVKLILDNVRIINPNGPAIACLEGDDLVIELKGENFIEDGKYYNGEYDEDVKSAIYSKADLSIYGEEDSILYLTANYQDGIVSKDDLKIKDGIYNIIAPDDAIRGKDSVYIIDGEFNVETSADAIKSTNETTAGKGFVLIENGRFNIVSGAKGIKATTSIIIKNGQYDINSFDDAIHSNSYISIDNGEFRIISGDDGIHADRRLIINDGYINIEKSYEGLEAEAITINNGIISLVSSDDGLNAGGGVDQSATNRPGAATFKTDENCEITINGGEITINSAGDGIDSNGYININGGKTIVDGPTKNNNAALDSDKEIKMTGGEVIALGPSGMAKNLGEKSSVYSLSVFFKNAYPADTIVTIRDSKNEAVMNYTSKKPFDHLAVGGEFFIPTETYTIFINNEKYESFTISNIVTTLDNSYDIIEQRR